MRKIIAQIPNSITCCNLLSGAVGVVMALNGEIHIAFLFIILSAIFDFFDGFTARLLKVTSPMGKELDSLADVISFGLLPSAMLFCRLGGIIDNWVCSCNTLKTVVSFTPFIIAAFSALRLAKFNLDERQHYGFIGLPTPADALFISSLLLASEHSAFILSILGHVWFIPVLSIVLSILLISEVNYFALKFRNFTFRENSERFYFGGLVLILIVAAFIIGANPYTTLFLIMLCYLISPFLKF